jgi:hypothetical protein
VRTHLLSARIPKARTDLTLSVALVVQFVWTLIAFAFLLRPGRVSNAPWGAIVAIAILFLLLSLWFWELIQRLAPGVERTRRNAVLTLLILTIPVLLPPLAHPLFLSFGILTLALLAIPGPQRRSESRAVDPRVPQRP